jgi:predicted outer membrane repeat protein
MFYDAVINGPGPNVLTVKGAGSGSYDIFEIADSAVTISGVTISNGDSGILNARGTINIANCAITGNRGGIFNDSGPVSISKSNISSNSQGIYSVRAPLTIANSTISGNSVAGDGAGIFCDFDTILSVTDSIISDNTTSQTIGSSGNGGGIRLLQGSTATITGTRLINNHATSASSFGGGLSAFSQSRPIVVNLFRCELSGNSSGFYGGAAVLNTNCTLNLINSTLSGNSAQRGGAIVNDGSGVLNMSNCTVSGNSATQDGGGLYMSGQNQVKSSIIALNDAPSFPDEVNVVSAGFNLIGKASSSATDPTDQFGTEAAPINPKLGPLAFNGGPTRTMKLLAGSPAINKGTSNGLTGPLPADQRGYVRQNTADIGAFELGATIPHTLGNISTRGFVGTANNVLIGGLIVTGNGGKKIIVRALGPTLGKPPFNVPGALANPTLELRNSSNVLVASNDNWGSASNKQAIIDSGFAPPDTLESAILTTVNPGNYTAIVRGVNNTTGIALIEAYDLDFTAGSEFGNISSRAFVQTGAKVMIAGVIVHGPDNQDVLIRGLGPTLSQFGVPTVLANPALDLRDANGNSIATNDNWKTENQAQIQATGLAPPNDAEAAILITLSPGNYTAILSGVGNTTGNALVEVYALN